MHDEANIGDYNCIINEIIKIFVFRFARANCRCTPWNYPRPDSNNSSENVLCDLFGNLCFEQIMSQQYRYFRDFPLKLKIGFILITDKKIATVRRIAMRLNSR